MNTVIKYTYIFKIICCVFIIMFFLFSLKLKGIEKPHEEIDKMSEIKFPERINSARSIIKSGKYTLENLISYIDNNYSSDSSEALLLGMGEEKNRTLIDYYNSIIARSDYYSLSLRIAAAYNLALITDTSKIELIVESLIDSEDQSIKSLYYLERLKWIPITNFEKCLFDFAKSNFKVINKVEIIQTLIHYLGEAKELNTRSNASGILASDVFYHDAVPFLLEALEAPNYRHRVNAALIFLQANDIENIKKTIPMLEDSNPEVSWRIAYILSEAKIEEAKPYLKASLLHTDNRTVLYSCIALSNLGDDSFVQYLTKLIEDNEEEIWKRAIQLVAENTSKEIRKGLMTILEKDDISENKRAAIKDILRNSKTVDSDELLIKLVNKDYDEEELCSIIETLGKRKVKNATNSLSDLLMFYREEIRDCAAIALGDIGDISTVEPLFNALNRNILPINNEVISEALGRFGRPVIPMLLEKMKSGDNKIILTCLGALRIIQDPVTVEIIKKYLDMKKYGYEIRSEAILGLGAIDSQEANNILLNELKKPQCNNKWIVIRALTQCNNERSKILIELLLSDEFDIIQSVSSCLKNMEWSPTNEKEKLYFAIGLEKWDEVPLFASMAIEPLVKLISDLSLSEDKANNAAVALGKINNGEAYQSLITLIKRSDPKIKTRASLGLAITNNKEAWNILLSEFQIVTNWSDKVKMMDSMLKISFEKSFPYILAEYGNDNSWYFSGLLSLLGKYNNKKTMSLNLKALNHLDREVREKAASNLDEYHWKPENLRQKVSYCLAKGNWSECYKLGKPAIAPMIELLGDRSIYNNKDQYSVVVKFGKPAVKELVKNLKSANKDIRLGSACILGQIADNSALNALIEQLKIEKDNEVQHTIVIALCSFPYKKVSSAIFGYLDTGRIYFKPESVEALKKHELYFRNDLNESIKSNHKYIILNSVKLLGSLGDRTSVKPLAELLKTGNYEFMSETIDSLGLIGDSSAIPFLDDFMKKCIDTNNYGYYAEYLRIRIINAYKNIGKPALQSLIDFLKIAKENEKKWVIQALREIKDPSILDTIIKMIDQGSDNENLCELSNLLGTFNDSKTLEGFFLLLQKNVRDNYKSCFGSRDEKFCNIFYYICRLCLPSRECKSYSYSYLLDDINNIKGLEESQIILNREIAIPHLVSLLHKTDPDIRDEVFKLLLKLRWNPITDKEKYDYYILLNDWEKCYEIGGEIIPSLLEYLNNDDIELNNQILILLSKFKDPETIDPIIKYVEKSRVFSSEAAEALSKIVPIMKKEGYIKIEELLKSNSVSGKYIAIEALGLMSLDESSDILINSFSHENTLLKKAIIKSLGKIGGSKEKVFLEKSIECDNYEIMISAVKTLQNLGWTPKTDRQEMLAACSNHNWEKLFDIASEETSDFIHILDYSPIEIKYEIIEALANSKFELAGCLLVELLRSSDPFIVNLALRELKRNTQKNYDANYQKWLEEICAKY